MQTEKMSSTRIDMSNSSVNQDILTAAKGSGILFLGRIFEETCQVIFVIMLARALGTTGYGLYNLGLGVESILAVIALMGLSEGMVRFIPFELINQNYAKIKRILAVGFTVSLSLGIGLGLILFSLAQVLAVRIFHEEAIIPILQLISITIPLEAFGQLLLGVVLGLKRMDYQVYSYSIIYSFVRLGLTVLFLSMGWNVMGAIIAYSIAWAVTIAVLFYFISRIISLRKLGKFSREDVSALAFFSVPLCLTDLTTQLRNYINLMLIGAMGTITSVGIYSVAMRVQMAGTLLMGPIVKAAKPIISDLSQQNEVERLKQVYQTMTRWSLTIILPLAITIILFARSILSIFGKDFTQGDHILILIGFGLLLSAATWVSQSMISMMGYSKITFFINVGSLVLTILFNTILIPKWDILGAAMASIIVILIVGIVSVVQVYALVGLLPYNLTFVKPLLAGTVTFLGILLLGNFLPAEGNFLYFLVNVTLLWIIYSLVLLLLGLPEQERTMLSRAIRKLDSIRRSF